MNVTPHISIPGLYNAWDKEVFSTIRALNTPEGRVWRLSAYRITVGCLGDSVNLGDHATRDEAVEAVKAWKNWKA